MSPVHHQYLFFFVSNVTLTKTRFYNAQKLQYLGVSENHVRTAGTAVSSGFLVSKDNTWSEQAVSL